MRFKKIYIEITNNCNLSCKFCSKNKKESKTMTFDEFKIIISKIKNYTSYIYMHVLGEPLIHPNVSEFIDYAYKNDINVNITTNGYLIDKIENNKNIRQLNISLHSYDEKYKVPLTGYLNKIYKVIDELKDNTYISFRIWTKSKYTKDIIKSLNKKFNSLLTIDNLEKIGNITLSKNVFLSISEEFIWPSLENNYYNETGKCMALKDHIGILSDGTIIPCCLDSKGIIDFGNIYEEDLNEVINSKRFLDMQDNFKNNKKKEELCKHCNFIK